jgi:hypothetical protein
MKTIKMTLVVAVADGVTPGTIADDVLKLVEQDGQVTVESCHAKNVAAPPVKISIAQRNLLTAMRDGAYLLHPQGTNKFFMRYDRATTDERVAYSSALTLVCKGLVTRTSTGTTSLGATDFYRITRAGRSALKAS